MSKIYRTDIDGLRAIAVISVILFHLGYLQNGYLGVDIFFVISGYLITGIVFNEVEENRFSVLRFYERRLRRIIPLVLFTTLITFLLGVVFMLPDDLENMCQSVVASNLSANNFLMYITSDDYWAVKNDYKPLMHTWSLGIEEQFYLLYPIIFFFLKGKKKKIVMPLLIGLTIFSLALFFLSSNVSSKFYFLQYRFFELSIGGICAIHFRKSNLKTKLNRSHLVLIFLLSVLLYLLYSHSINSNDIKVLVVTILTAAILVIGGFHFERKSLYRIIISNGILRGIGKISFSLYMWHQIVFAFSRYILTEEFTVGYSIALSIVVVLLSIMSYYIIENPFRNRKRLKTKSVLIIISISFFVITGVSFYVYAVGGVIKDVPELGLSRTLRPEKYNFFSKHSNINIRYNENVRSLDVPFSSIEKIKILVIGDSFGRDFSNIIRESSFYEDIELSYIINPQPTNETYERFNKADYIFYATHSPPTKEKVIKRIENFNVGVEKLWIVGTKDFGNSNGIYYNKNKNRNESCQENRAFMKNGVSELNEELKMEWGARYIDLIGLVVDANGKVLVFTPDCKFISQDTMHLTKSGASYFAKLLNSKLRGILNI